MGDDLVQRLRNEADQFTTSASAAIALSHAADVIERLRAEVALFKSELERANARCAEEHGLRELAERELAALRERIEGGKVGYLRDDPDGYRFLLDTHGRLAQMEEQENSFSAWLGRSQRVRLLVEE